MKGKLADEELWAIFGPETEKASEYAGALSFGDARLLLFPVRSLAGVFAWCTSVDILARFHRELVLVGQAPDWKVPQGEQNESEAWVNGQALVAGDKVVLEEFSFTPVENPNVASIGSWLAENALLSGDEYLYWKNTLPKNLCILPKDAFRDFTQFATEVQTHIKLNSDKKTVESGALWTSESLPVDTVLYAPLVAQATRHPTIRWDAPATLNKISQAGLTRLNFGGDETTVQGFTALRFMGGQA